MMKKYISLILVVSMAMTLFTGCRETQDAPAEMQKDQEAEGKQNRSRRKKTLLLM